MRDLGDIDHRHFAHALFELAEAGIDKAPLPFGGVVLAFSPLAAVSAGFQDFFGKLVAQLIFKRGDFLLQVSYGRPAWITDSEPMRSIERGNKKRSLWDAKADYSVADNSANDRRAQARRSSVRSRECLRRCGVGGSNCRRCASGAHREQRFIRVGILGGAAGHSHYSADA